MFQYSKKVFFLWWKGKRLKDYFKLVSDIIEGKPKAIKDPFVEAAEFLKRTMEAPLTDEALKKVPDNIIKTLKSKEFG